MTVIFTTIIPIKMIPLKMTNDLYDIYELKNSSHKRKSRYLILINFVCGKKVSLWRRYDTIERGNM